MLRPVTLIGYLASLVTRLPGKSSPSLNDYLIWLSWMQNRSTVDNAMRARVSWRLSETCLLFVSCLAKARNECAEPVNVIARESYGIGVLRSGNRLPGSKVLEQWMLFLTSSEISGWVTQSQRESTVPSVIHRQCALRNLIIIKLGAALQWTNFAILMNASDLSCGLLEFLKSRHLSRGRCFELRAVHCHSQQTHSSTLQVLKCKLAKRFRMPIRTFSAELSAVPQYHAGSAVGGNPPCQFLLARQIALSTWT